MSMEIHKKQRPGQGRYTTGEEQDKLENASCSECGWHHSEGTGHWECVICGKLGPAGYGMWAMHFDEDETKVCVGPCFREYSEIKKAAQLLTVHGTDAPCHTRGCQKPATVLTKSPRWDGERALCEWCHKLEKKNHRGGITRVKLSGWVGKPVG